MSNQWLRTISTAALIGAIVIAVGINGWSWLLVGALALVTLMAWGLGKTSASMNQQAAQRLSKAIFPKRRQKTSTSPTNDSALSLRINEYAHLAHIMAPSSQVGPEPMLIPVTGYSMVAEMVCRGKIDFMILGFRAEVIRQTSFQSDGTRIALPPDPNRISFLPPEEEELVQKGMEAFRPLEIPHFEILLDKHPSIIRPALKADGLPARPTPQLPFTLHPDEYRSFFLAPVTHSPDLTVWSLYAMWEFEGKRQESPYGTFQVTGHTGWMTFHPEIDGYTPDPTPTPVNEVAYDHWDIQYNSTL